MKTTLTGIEPIPVEYILRIAQSKATAAQRRPYIELILQWGEEMGCPDEAQQLLKSLREGQVLDPCKMPRDFMPRFRQQEVAEKLIDIVRHIDAVIASKQENWTWALRPTYLRNDSQQGPRHRAQTWQLCFYHGRTRRPMDPMA